MLFCVRYGIVLNSDSVLRSVFYKYLHPKEVHIGEGVLVPDIARKKVNVSPFVIVNCFSESVFSLNFRIPLLSEMDEQRVLLLPRSLLPSHGLHQHQ